MKLSYTTMATPGKSVRNEAELARRFGYRGIDLRVSDHMGEIRLESSRGELLETRDILESEGILLAGLFCYNRCADGNENSWNEMKESILKHLELADVMGSPSIRIFAGDPLKHRDREGYIKKTAEAITAALDSHKTQVSVILQNHLNGFSAGQGVEMAEIIGNPRFGLAFSPDHCILMDEEPEKIAAMLRKHTRQLYAADMTVKDGKHQSRLPGKGMVPLRDAYELIGGRSFDGWITFKWEKIWNPELDEAEKVLPYFVEYINENFV